MQKHSLFIFYGGKRMQNVLFVLGDENWECLDLPLSQFPNLQIETVHPSCIEPDTVTKLKQSLDEILLRRSEEKRYAIFHFSLGGDREKYTEAELKVADAMDVEVANTFRSYGFEVMGIEAKSGECSLKFVQEITKILTS
jgi:hypothetical protein